MQINGESMEIRKCDMYLPVKFTFLRRYQTMQLDKRQPNLTNTCLFNQLRNILISQAGEVVLVSAYSLSCV